MTTFQPYKCSTISYSASYRHILKLLNTKATTLNHEHHTRHEGAFYVHNVLHRNGNPQKSQWSISELDERNCFENAAGFLHIYGWTLTFCCWGLHFSEGGLSYLGISAANSSDPRRELFIAKFVDSNQNNRWHGYPADHVDHPQDIPPENILSHWMRLRHLSPAKIRKISKGQRCKI